MSRAGSTSLIVRRVRVRLVGGRVLEGDLHLAEGQSLVGTMALRRYFLNLTRVSWVPDDGPAAAVPHLAIRVNQIVWLLAPDGDVPLTSGIQPTTPPRSVELHLVGGVRLDVSLHLATEQRMSDYFDSNAGFVPLRDVRIAGSDEVYSGLALNHEAILAIRET